MDINLTLNRLKEGNQRFVSGQSPLSLNCHKDISTKLISNQSPYAAILSCADSRVIPELIFDANLGELFVVRVAGHVANADTIASMEYAVAHLKVHIIIVLGHQNCGAIQQAILTQLPKKTFSNKKNLEGSSSQKTTNTGHSSSHLDHLLTQIQPAILTTPSENPNEIAKTHVKLICDILETHSSIIQEALKKKELKVVPAYYSLKTKALEFLNPAE